MMAKNHPNRKQIRFPASLLAGISGPPHPDQVLGERINSGLTQTQAAELVYVPLRTWQRWEWGEARMPAAAWALFLIRTHLTKTAKYASFRQTG